MLPQFIIAGAAKSGTTSLYHYLDQHPQIFMSKLKETNYFAVGDPFVEQNWEGYPFLVKTLQEYESLFENAGNNKVLGEASPIYLESKLAAARIRDLIPQAKIIILLRNPIKRAYSGYLMHVRYNNEKVTNVAQIRRDDFNLEKRFVRSSFYYENVKRYFDCFPREQIKIYVFEEFIANTKEYVRDCCEFLGVDDTFDFDLEQTFNPGQFPRSSVLNRFLMNDFMRNKVSKLVPDQVVQFGKSMWKANHGKAPKMPEQINEYLESTYSEDVAMLEQLISRDLSIWNIKKPKEL